MLEKLIQADPDGPPLVKGTGGLRKTRFADRGSGRGKRGSYRVGYAHFRNPGIILLLEAGTPPAGTCVLNVGWGVIRVFSRATEPQHFLYFLPLPHGQCSFLPILSSDISSFA